MGCRVGCRTAYLCHNKRDRDLGHNKRDRDLGHNKGAEIWVKTKGQIGVLCSKMGCRLGEFSQRWDAVSQIRQQAVVVCFLAHWEAREQDQGGRKECIAASVALSKARIWVSQALS